MRIVQQAGKSTKITYSQIIAAPFLFIPIVGNTKYGSAVTFIIVISLLIICFFTILIGHSLFVGLHVDSSHCNIKEPNESLKVDD